MKAYENYKYTELSWADSIPNHWEVLSLQSILANRKERNNPVKTSFILSLTANKGVIPYTEKTGGGNKAKENISDYNIAYQNDLLVNCMNVVSGSSGLSKYYGAISPVYYAFSPRKDTVNIEFYTYLFRSSQFYQSLVGLGNGILMNISSTGKLNTVRKRIPMTKFNRVMLPKPPIAEQEQIVKFLNWKTSNINRLIAAKKKQITLLNEQKRTIINQAVTKGLDPSVELKDSGVPWLGKIPAHWEQFSIFQCAEEQNLSNKTIHNQNLLSLSYGKIINKDINTTTGLLPESFDTYQIVHNGNIVLRLTDLQNDKVSLRVGISTQTGIITSAYTCLKARSNAVPKFLYYMLHAYDLRKVFYGMGGGLRQSIGFKELRKLTAFLPHESEQNLIIKYCESNETIIAKAISAIKQEITLLQEYRTRLISDVVTGQIDLRDIVIPENITTMTDEENEEENEETEVKKNDD